MKTRKGQHVTDSNQLESNNSKDFTSHKSVNSIYMSLFLQSRIFKKRLLRLLECNALCLCQSSIMSTDHVTRFTVPTCLCARGSGCVCAHIQTHIQTNTQKWLKFPPNSHIRCCSGNRHNTLKVT